MLRRLTHSFRRLAEDTAGSEIAEAAAVLPILLMVLLGIFWFGQAFRIYGTITRAAQDGARAAAAPTCTTCATGTTPGINAHVAVRNVLVTANINTIGVQRLATTPSLLSCVGGTPPACETDALEICVQKDVQLSDPATGGTGACGVSVSFRYPYQFWLPFTTLNQQLIYIPAVARVRQETR